MHYAKVVFIHGMLDLIADFNGTMHFFLNFTLQRFLRRFPFFDFPTWKFPKVFQCFIGSSLRAQNLISVRDDRSYDVDVFLSSDF